MDLSTVVSLSRGKWVCGPPSDNIPASHPENPALAAHHISFRAVRVQFFLGLSQYLRQMCGEGGTACTCTPETNRRAVFDERHVKTCVQSAALLREIEGPGAMAPLQRSSHSHIGPDWLLTLGGNDLEEPERFVCVHSFPRIGYVPPFSTILQPRLFRLMQAAPQSTAENPSF
jgi:hypothetical protein